MQLKYFKELDGVRGFAALMVVFFHINQLTEANSPFLKLLHKTGTFGQTGVILFFVLSGFLITRILLASKAKDNYFKSFYIRRSLRIFPLYYLALVIFLVIIPLVNTGEAISFANGWTFWVYLQNIAMTFKWHMGGPGHFWSLSVEEHFYLVWPFIVYYTPQNKLLRVIVLLAIISFICRFIMLYLGYGTFYFTLTNMDFLTFGAIAALNNIYKWVSVKKILYSMPVTLVLLAAAWYIFKDTKTDYLQLFKSPLIAIFYTLIIMLLIEKTTVLNKFFSLQPLRFTGKISYSLYIFHPLCIEFALKYFNTKSFIPTFLFIFISSYAVACLSYYLYEIWFLKLKDRFENFNWSNRKSKNESVNA